jgi:methylated-DNA-[protein]-cysteine S-methyltransferase
VAAGHALFDTAIGRCGIAWAEDGIRAVQLPEGDDAATVTRLRRRSPRSTEVEPPASIRQAMEGIAALMRGQGVDLCGIPLDMGGVPAFRRRVYEATRRIPPGSTRTYGEIAALLGVPGAARAVGQALGHNPFAPVVPCHRVLAANGRPGGFSAHGALATKLRMLLIERAAFGAPGLFDGEP